MSFQYLRPWWGLGGRCLALQSLEAVDSGCCSELGRVTGSSRELRLSRLQLGCDATRSQFIDVEGALDQDNQSVGVDFSEASLDEHAKLAGFAQGGIDNPWAKCRDDRRMAGEHGEFTLDAGHDHLRRVLRE